MSVMSVLMTRSRAELASAWQWADFDALGISFVDKGEVPAASGLLVFQGVSFRYDIQDVPPSEAERFIFCNANIRSMQSAVHLDFGPAVEGGNLVPAAVKTLLQLGEVLGQVFASTSIFWQPAGILTGFDFFAEAVTQYVEGAAFPALVCVDFDTSDSDSVKTNGLMWLGGQEIMFEHAPLSTLEAMRYMVRLVHDIATLGAVDSEIEVPGMGSGEIIRLTPRLGNKLLSVRRIVLQ